MKSVAEALSLYIFKFQGMCWLNVQRRKQKQKQMEKWPSLIKAMRKADDPHALTAQHSSSHLQQCPSALH
jgi:hypothetical protein